METTVLIIDQSINQLISIVLCREEQGDRWTDNSVRCAVLSLLKHQSQSTLAKLSPLSQSTISNIANGKYNNQLSTDKCREFGNWYTKYLQETDYASTSGGHPRDTRMTFHPDHELPLLRTWYKTCKTPSHEKFVFFANELNKGHIRQDRPKISAAKLKIWWKNEKQRERRMTVTAASDSKTPTRSLRSSRGEGQKGKDQEGSSRDEAETEGNAGIQENMLTSVDSEGTTSKHRTEPCQEFTRKRLMETVTGNEMLSSWRQESGTQWTGTLVGQSKELNPMAIMVRQTRQSKEPGPDMTRQSKGIGPMIDVMLQDRTSKEVGPLADMVLQARQNRELSPMVDMSRQSKELGPMVGMARQSKELGPMTDLLQQAGREREGLGHARGPYFPAASALVVPAEHFPYSSLPLHHHHHHHHGMDFQDLL